MQTIQERMENLLHKLQEASKFLAGQFSKKPEVGVVLGSGLGSFVNELEVEKEIPYGDIPYFPVSTVEGHSGKLIFGHMAGKAVICMAGRFHFYEGYTPDEVVFPVRVMVRLGVHHLLLSNAAGGVNPHFSVGDLMIIKDHISFATKNPLLGKNIPELGPRFPDMSEPYKKDLIKRAREIGVEHNIKLQEGVYFGVTGPTFETRAEYKMIQMVGGDAVGMSTVQECIAANHMGVPVFAISVITDIGVRDEENVITHEEVLHFAREAEPKLTLVFRELIRSI